MKFNSFDQTSPKQIEPAREWFAGTAPSSLAGEDYFQLLYLLASGVAASLGKKPLVVAVAGAQGSGKSTLSRLLKDLLESVFDVSVADISLDDFYLSRADREELAAKVHPMLRVRGVPGTHDIKLLADVMGRLREGLDTEAPVFDKSEDDRSPTGRRISGASVVLCEGWCWGATPQTTRQLEVSVNSLEQAEDPNGTWRHYVNAALQDYQAVFASDALVFLQVPDMDAVYRWRWQQEQVTNSGGSATMNEHEVRQFIAYYERITRWMLEECPSRADVTIRLDEGHRVQSAVIARIQ